MRTIVAIGGGLLEPHETLDIDKEIVKLTKKKKPVALFIPPQSRDIHKYWTLFQKTYGEKLACTTTLLNLNNHTPPYEEIKNRILSADLIYVGGGNTLQMMRRWRKLGVDNLLREASEQGIVLSGISAGAICWFAYGHSNSIKHYNREKWHYIRVAGLGFIPAIHCPHYTEEKRHTEFAKMIQKKGGIGIALDANAALEVIDNKYRVLVSQKEARGYKIYKKNGNVMTETLMPDKKFRDLKQLLNEEKSA